jgi:hypothetical protein
VDSDRPRLPISLLLDRPYRQLLWNVENLSSPDGAESLAQRWDERCGIRPAIADGAQHDDPERKPYYVLLVWDSTIHGHQSMVLGGRALQQLAIGEAIPAAVANCLYLELGTEKGAQPLIQLLVKQHAHGR